MFEEYKKCLIVDATNINKSLLEVKREMIANDFLHIYEETGIIKAQEIFEKYEMPLKYQKIIIMKKVARLSNVVKLYEICTGYSFFIKNKNSSQNNISIVNKTINNNPFVLLPAHTIKIDKIKPTNYKEAIDFYQEMFDNEYFIKYLKCLNELFDLNLDIELLYELSSQEKNRRKALKLYKKGNKPYLC